MNRPRSIALHPVNYCLWTNRYPVTCILVATTLASGDCKSAEQAGLRIGTSQRQSRLKRLLLVKTRFSRPLQGPTFGAPRLLPWMACMPVLQEQKPVIEARFSAGVWSAP